MTPKRPAQGGANEKRKRRQAGVEAPNPDTAQQPRGERSFVDIDPWAMLLEQLMETPEEGQPTSHQRPRRK